MCLVLVLRMGYTCKSACALLLVQLLLQSDGMVQQDLSFQLMQVCVLLLVHLLLHSPQHGEASFESSPHLQQRLKALGKHFG